MACTSCGIYQELETISETYARASFEALAPAYLKLFLVFSAVLVLWKIGIEGVLNRTLNPAELFKLVITILMVNTFLTHSAYYFDWFYAPLKEITLKTTQVMIRSVGRVGGEDILALLATVEQEIDHVFQLASAIKLETSWYQVGNHLGVFLLMIPYVFVWGLFLAYSADLMFGLLAITALAPLFIAGYVFPLTRPYSEGAIRMTVSCCLTVIFAGVAMGFTIAILKHYIATIPVNSQGVMQGAGVWVFSKAYWSLFLIGFLSVLFHLKAAKMATSIAGAGEGSGSTGLVVGAGMMAAGIAQKSLTTSSRRILETMGNRSYAALTKQI